MSHGAFYQYFKNKDDFAHVLVLDAMRPLGTALAGIPSPVRQRPRAPRFVVGSATTTPVTYTKQRLSGCGSMRRNPDAALGSDAAPAIDWGRRRMARYLQPREFGEVGIL